MMAARRSTGLPRRGGSLRPAALALLGALAIAACGAEEPAANPIAPVGAAGAGGAGGSGGAAGGGPDCFMNPKTHREIINACTNAVRVKRTPNLKGLNADGSLPPPP
ncbi:MAG TPA: hypothetical protein VFS43_09560 [Polyangiaceae bacterium]|nr:hypothetical protein [Polyangiaceae bacterium]